VPNPRQLYEIHIRLLRARYKISRMQDKPLEIEKLEKGPGTTVLRLHGPLLLGNFFPLQTMVRADNSDLLIIDVGDMPYIDSAGIGCLVGAHVSRENSGRKLILVGANDRLLTSLKVTKVEQLFTVAPTVEQAMAQAGHH
jgi:anti-anti-sigma factor